MPNLLTIIIREELCVPVDCMRCNDDSIRASPLDIFIAVDIDTTAGFLDKSLEQTFLTLSIVLLAGSLIDTVHTNTLLGLIIG